MDSKIQRPHLERLLKAVTELPPLKMAVVHPVGKTSLLGVIEAANENLIEPVLIGPAQRIKQAADDAKLNISAYQLC